MGTRAWGGAVISGMLAGIFMLEGCAPKATPPLAEDVRAQLGTVGLVTPGFQPEFDYRPPGQNGTQGALAGAGSGLLIGTLGAAGCFFSMGQLLGACALGLATPYLAVRFAVDRTERGVSGEAIEEAEGALKAALDDLSLQELLKAKILQSARVDTPLIAAPASGPRRPSETVQYGSLAGEGVDTTLELTVLEVGLGLPTSKAAAGSSLWEPGNPDPMLQLRVVAQGRLIRTRDGVELYAYKDTQISGAERFTEWAADGARRFRDDLDAVCGSFAKDLMLHVYGPASAAQPREPQQAPTVRDPVTTDSLAARPPE